MSISRAIAAFTAALALVLGLVAVGPTSPALGISVGHDRVVSDDPANWTPDVLDGPVKAIAQVGNTMIVGGDFTEVQEAGGGERFDRSRIFAFDATTGAIRRNFAPTLDAGVDAIVSAGDGTSVFVSGNFSTVNGQRERRVTRLDLADGSRTDGFNATGFNGVVKDLRLHPDGQLIVAGNFSRVGGVDRPALASLDPQTGQRTDFVAHDIVTTRDGSTQVLKMDLSPDGSRLATVGNFTSVDGQSRPQLAVYDTSGGSSTLADWQSDFYAGQCASVFDTYMRDVDIDPTGEYLVVSTTGAYRGPDSPCDVLTRFELGQSGTGIQPTWRDYTGGDTTYAIISTGAAVYAGGHMRWANNPFSGDAVGPGAVPREGILALDPSNGLPFTWNPGRARGVGTFDIIATDAGLWVGSDTNRIGGEIRKKLAFFPLQGGSVVPPVVTGQLPNDVYQLGRSGLSDPSVLHRINAGGPTLLSADDGPNWSSGTGGGIVNTGNNATWDAVGSVDGSVPSSDEDRAPRALFDSERWDPGSEPEMRWSLPVPAGTSTEVRLYLANRCTCTDQVGERVFDVAIDGTTVIDDLDLVASYGHDTGHMESFQVTSDGTIDIEFGHVTENPLVNGIEVIDLDAAADPGDSAVLDQVRRQFLSGTGEPGPTESTDGDHSWRLARGGFMIGTTLYTGWADGNLYAATAAQDGTFGPRRAVDLYGGNFASDLGNITGMTYADSRIYYTLYGSNALYWRWFTPESEVVGAQRFTATGDVAALSPSSVAGLFHSRNHLYFADADSGNLHRVAFDSGVVSGPAETVDGSLDWSTRALVVWTGDPGPQPNVDPTAVASVVGGECADATCSFSSDGSTDPDGEITSYDWDFGDGATSSNANPQHTYTDSGTYTVTLTVTDNRGATATTTIPVEATVPANVDPTAVASVVGGECADATCSFSSDGSTDPDGEITSYDWDFGDGATSSNANPQHTYTDSGTYTVTLTVTDNLGATGQASLQASVTVAEVGPVEFVASSSQTRNRTSITTTIPAAAQPGDTYILFVSANKSTAVLTATDPAWQPLDTITDQTMRTHAWIATAGADGPSTTTITSPVRAKLNAQLTIYRGLDPTNPIATHSGIRETTKTADHTTPTITTGIPTGAWAMHYWADKTSATTGWTTPPELTQREQSIGRNNGRITSVTADTNGPTPTPAGGHTATATSSNNKATMWTLILNPA